MNFAAMVEASSPPGTAKGSAMASVSVGTFIAHAWGYVPGIVAAMAGLLAIVWYSISIYESDTAKTWRTEHTQRRKTRRISRLRAKERVITAQLEALELRRSAAASAAELMRSAEQTAAEKVAVAAAAAKVEAVRSDMEARK